MLSSYDMIINVVSSENRASIDGQTDLFGSAEQSPVEIKLPDMEEYSLPELLEMEKQITGLYISGHPLSAYTGWMTASGMTTAKKIIDGFSDNPPTYKDKQEVSLMAIFRSKRVYKTKSGTNMAFCIVEDSTSEIEAVVFPNVYDSARNLLMSGNLLAIEGRITIKDEETPKISADSVQTVDDYVEELKKRPLCLKLKSTDKDKISALRKLCEENKGEGRLIGYLSDLKKSIDIKGANSINISNETISELIKIFGVDNVKFTVKKGQ